MDIQRGTHDGYWVKAKENKRFEVKGKRMLNILG